MIIDDTKINKMLEEEIKNQVAKRIDSTLDKIIKQELKKVLYHSPKVSNAIGEAIKNDKEFRKNVAQICSNELYNSLVVRDTDNEYNSDDLDWE